MESAVIEMVTSDAGSASSVLLGLILAAILAERMAHYYFLWRKQQPSSADTIDTSNVQRLALKRESDRHMEAMSKSMADLASNQKQTADALHNLGETVHSIKSDTAILVDRKA